MILAGKVLKIFLYITLIISFIWIGFAITGHTSRQYQVLLPYDKISVSNDTLSAGHIAEIYQPILYLESSYNDHTNPTCMYYEVIENDSTIFIIYHPQWEDEIYPNKIIHYLYKFYRLSRYGIPSRDCEYIQLSINKTDGSIIGVKFETNTKESKFGTGFQKHLISNLILLNGFNYEMSVTERNGKLLIDKEKINLSIENKSHLKIGISTWNHLFTAKNLSNYTYPENFNLIFLDNKTYKCQKFARKGQGDFKTQESITSKAFSYLFAIMLSFLMVIFIKRRKNG